MRTHTGPCLGLRLRRGERPRRKNQESVVFPAIPQGRCTIQRQRMHFEFHKASCSKQAYACFKVLEEIAGVRTGCTFRTQILLQRKLFEMDGCGFCSSLSVFYWPKIIGILNSNSVMFDQPAFEMNIKYQWHHPSRYDLQASTSPNQCGMPSKDTSSINSQRYEMTAKSERYSAAIGGQRNFWNELKWHSEASKIF